MKHRPPRSDSDLEQTARDVRYEIEMLIESASDVGSVWASPSTTLADAHKNMALECFLLHFRNLRAFLCPSLQAPPRPDTVVASDFLRKSTPHDIGHPNKIRDDKERLDQMLAHISYNRHKKYITKGKMDWYVGRMAVAMIQQVEVFLDVLPDYMKPWFSERTMLSQKRCFFAAWANEPTTFAYTPGTSPLRGEGI